jgi:hypothetical protein
MEIIMIGTKGFRAREAAANYKRRERRLVSDEVRAARFANLHGNAEPAEETEVKPAQTESVKEAETHVEGQEAAEAEGAEKAAAGVAAKEAAEKATADAAKDQTPKGKHKKSAKAEK